MSRVSSKLISFWDKNGRYINLGSLALGFLFDLYMAKRPDSLYNNVLLFSYLTIAASIIISLNLRKNKRQMQEKEPVHPLVPIFVLQFCFGGLAGNMLILYGKSGTIGASLLFIGLLGAFALGNEFLKTRYDQLRFNVAIYYFLLLTYCIIFVPTFILHTIGTFVFLVSGAASLVIIALFLALLHNIVFRRREWQKIYEVSIIILIIFFVFNGLYFLNIIPPVPLSLKQIGIYHTLTPIVSGGDALYDATYEAPAWYVFWRDTSSVYTIAQGEGAFCYSAVFAPGDLSTPIVHRWEEYNTDTKEWETQSLATFPISGGRAGGYRGYSIETGLTPGDWRCDVETGRGQLIGRIAFSVEEGTPTLSTTQL